MYMIRTAQEKLKKNYFVVLYKNDKTTFEHTTVYFLI